MSDALDLDRYREWKRLVEADEYKSKVICSLGFEFSEVTEAALVKPFLLSYLDSKIAVLEKKVIPIRPEVPPAAVPADVASDTPEAAVQPKKK